MLRFHQVAQHCFSYLPNGSGLVSGTVFGFFREYFRFKIIGVVEVFDRSCLDHVRGAAVYSGLPFMDGIKLDIVSYIRI